MKNTTLDVGKKVPLHQLWGLPLESAAGWEVQQHAGLHVQAFSLIAVVSGHFLEPLVLDVL